MRFSVRDFRRTPECTAKYIYTISEPPPSPQQDRGSRIQHRAAFLLPGTDTVCHHLVSTTLLVRWEKFQVSERRSIA